MAVANLKRQANKKSEGSLACVKGGLSTFFEAQDALSGKAVLAAICAGGRGDLPAPYGNLTPCPRRVYRLLSVFIKGRHLNVP